MCALHLNAQTLCDLIHYLEMLIIQKLLNDIKNLLTRKYGNCRTILCMYNIERNCY